MRVKTIFEVNGKPFFPLGGQLHNSSAYNAEEMERGFRALTELHANVAEVAVYWEQIEPREGEFDLSILDILLEMSRKSNLKLILLWFGTWKNGTMKYAPEWVKSDKSRFKRVVSKEGTPISVLSEHCKETMESDLKAFCRMMEYLRIQDDSQKTVIAVQVENEPGIIGSERDFSEEANRVFVNNVSPQLINGIRKKTESDLYHIWKKNGSKDENSWEDVFGENASELFTAWHIGKYIDKIAQAGKRIYHLPMYVNVWLDKAGLNIPGVNYPSGGAIAKCLDIWKLAAPNIDLIAPDIYRHDHKGYGEACKEYSRADNPLFIPESGLNESNSMNMFSAIADYHAIGYSLFAVEDIIRLDGSPRPEIEPLIGSFIAASSALPLIVKYLGTEKIHAIVQEEYMFEKLLELDGYLGLVRFFRPNTDNHQLDKNFLYLDYHHNRSDEASRLTGVRGRGLVIQTGEHEFFLIGGGYRLIMRRKGIITPSQVNEYTHSRIIDYVNVEEGHFDADGNWIILRKRNGDESDFGIWVQPDVGVVHVVLNK